MTAGQEKLRALMLRHGLRRKDVARVMGVSVFTVHNWLRPVSNRAHRRVSDVKVKTLALRLARLERFMANLTGKRK